jgi:hypothetical protein
MRKAVVVARGRFGHQHDFGGAFVEGLKKRGWQASLESNAGRCDLLVLWSVRNRPAIASQLAAGGEVCILERGYVGDRFSYTSVSFGGGLNGRAEFRGPAGDPSRWNKHFAPFMKPWRRNDDGYALIMGQVPGDSSIQDVDIESWYSQTAKACQNVGMDVRFRCHPLAGKRGGSRAAGIKWIDGSLDDAARGARVVITYNSNSGVDAAMAGVPVVTMDRGAMAWPVAGHQVDEIIMPDREPWAHWLAWTQWSRDEMASGECLETIGL